MALKPRKTRLLALIALLTGAAVGDCLFASTVSARPDSGTASIGSTF